MKIDERNRLIKKCLTIINVMDESLDDVTRASLKFLPPKKVAAYYLAKYLEEQEKQCNQN